MPVPTSQLRALNMVVQEGSFSGAAKRLGMTQSAISQAITKLQNTYNVKLFEQTGRHLIPTDLCLELTQVTEQLQRIEEEAAYILQKKKSHNKGVLKIGLGNSKPGIDIIQAFQHSYPDVHVHVQLGNYAEIIDAVWDHNVDLGVLPDVPKDSRFQTKKYRTQEVVAIVNSGHPLAGNPIVSLLDLIEFPLIFRTSGSVTQRILDHSFKNAGLSPEPKLILETRDGVCEAVASGMGVGFIWRHGTGRLDGIVRMAISDIPQTFEEVVFCRSDSKSRLVESFFQSVIEVNYLSSQNLAP